LGQEEFSIPENEVIKVKTFPTIKGMFYGSTEFTYLKKFRFKKSMTTKELHYEIF